jgi:threonine/homoserine/homoserine lactone efflux protein
VRDALGVLLVAVGIGCVLLTRDKLGLVIAFAGVTLLAYGVLRLRLPGATDGKEPPIF